MRRIMYIYNIKYETGLSDFHNMIMTVLKDGYIKRSPKIIMYRDYRNFDIQSFRKNLKENLGANQNSHSDYSAFASEVETVLNRHAPLKKKYVRANDGPFMTKALRKSIMLRTQLRNKYNKERSQSNLNTFRKQRNKCVKLLRKAKFEYYKNLNLKDISDNRKFWKTVKPIFSDKVQMNSSITLNEDGKILTNELEIAEVFNNFFINITDSLGILREETSQSPGQSEDPINIASKKYVSHPSIIAIRENFKINQKFDFREVTVGEMCLQLSKLDFKKAAPKGSIPTKILKENADIFSDVLQSNMNSCFAKLEFPEDLKAGDVSALFKSTDTLSKKNYRPIMVLPPISKVFERIMYEQMMTFVTSFLSNFLCGFRKGYNTQHALLNLIEKCKRVLDDKGYAGAILMDLSKAFDCLDHELLLAKLDAYGFSKNALRFINSYLTGRKQRVKVNGAFSEWQQTKLGVPQGSVLGPLLFNIYINDLFYLLKDTDICNYADDTTIYVCDNQLENIKNRLERDALKLSGWFHENYMKLNDDKCHLLVFGDKTNDVSVKVGNSLIKESSEEKLLGVTIDKNLSFKTHLNSLCKKASQKLHALARISKFMDTDKRVMMMNTFVMSQFSYCPLIWMFHDRRINNKINKIHERALRIAYRDSHSCFEFLLEKNNSVSLHQKNLQLLLVEIFKTKENLNPSFMNDIFVERTENYNLRSGNTLQLPKARTTTYGIESVSFLGSLLWHALPESMKKSENFAVFKRKLKSWKGLDCNCRLCKIYIADLGYL